MTADRPSLRVLVVDENAGNRALLDAYLARQGCVALFAESGYQALPVFELENPDIVLIDVTVPAGPIEAIKRMRAHPSPRWRPIVIISAPGAEADVTRGLDAGADDYLLKPLSYKVFAAKMRTLSRMLMGESEREVAAAREHMVSDAVGAGIITFDQDGRIVDLNPAAARLFALERDTGHSLSIASLMASAKPTAVLEWLRTCARGADLINGVRRMTARAVDGRRFPVELRVRELNLARRRMFVAVVHDLSGSQGN